MPNRIVREGILRSRAVCNMDPLAQLFYRCLHSVADDFGRYYAEPELLLSDCFPLRPAWADEESLVEWLGACIRAGVIKTYSVNGTKYLEIVKFDQRIRPGAKSKFPAAAESCGDPPPTAADSGDSREKTAYARAASPSSDTTPHTSSDTDTPTPSESTLRSIAGKELFERMIGAFLAAGVALNEPDMLAAGTEWVSLPETEWEIATWHIEAKAPVTETRFMGLPANYLRKREWTRRGPGRLLPIVREPTKAEQSTAEALRIVQRGRSF